MTTLDVTGSFPESWVAPGQFYEGTHYILRKATENRNKHATVVLVHGIGSYFASFDHVANSILKAGYSTLQYDFYGRGFSQPSPTGLYDEHIHIDQLSQLLTFLQTKGDVTQKIHIIGHSMGGAFVTLYTARFPDSILSLTVCTPAGLMKSFAVRSLTWFTSFESWLKPAILGKSQMIRASHRDFHLSHGVYNDRKQEFLQQMILQADHSPTIFDAMWKCLLEFPLNDITTAVEKVASCNNLRVLVLWAQYDQMIPMGYNLGQWESLLELGQCRWRTSIIEDAGHMFVIEHFEKVAEQILETIRESENDLQITSSDPGLVDADVSDGDRRQAELVSEK